MNGGNALDQAIKGFVEGLGLVLVEMVLAIMISMFITVQQVTSNITPHNVGLSPTFSIPLMLGLFGAMNIVESVIIGFGDIPYAFGYCIGAICSLFLFGAAVTNIYPQAVSATIGVIVIVIIGMFIKIYMITIREGRGGGF
jgi:hypothetical protein